ncbi:ComEA family DNA-binding protein [Nesterenkonia sp. MY13]|uniref:ComEA family DNA-binding protein n=1 Tax=Nesterenkonia sedimenti TaxID=1463632 RepID=A0A7X8TJZ7_9MICC|nr:ComEA family DNA-binding protein [Nesterenkonia sedimenti]NLS10176.1 ComEA family DNA-binding protein [Nesterenkonia sedimenti]
MQHYDPELEGFPEDREIFTRRERLRAQREVENASPVRLRLGISVVLVVLAGALSWMTVSWLLDRTASSEPLPEAPALGEEDQEDDPGETQQENRPPSPGGASAEGEDNTGEGPILVHVAGGVAEPQVVELDHGARVIEAVEAAGGLTDEAAAEGINLAAEAQDGTLIYVPTSEELESGAGAELPHNGAGTAPDADDGTAGDDQAAININTADAQELEELPGIGPALAERIITYRQTHGDFGSVEELAAVSGIGPAIIENITDSVTW